MRSASIPLDEARRLQALHELDILDTEFEPAYDAIVKLAAIICEVPIVAINLIDADRQWGKAVHGLPSSAGPRELSFCAHTILENDTMIVSDTHADDRFSDNPAVVQWPRIRFYAGQPVLAPDGSAVGALCVVDVEPRQLSEQQTAALRALARQAAILLELRLRSRQLEREVVERRKAECEAQQARVLSDAANLAKSHFLSRMSHELRTPLNSVIGFSRTLLRNRDGNLSPRDLQYLSRVEANGRHLLHVIDDVLDLAKIESGRMTADIARVDLAELVRATVQELQGRVLGDTASTTQLVTEIPAAVQPIMTDETRLKQMIINLVGNALKFTNAGRVCVRIVADLNARPIRIDVEDTGIGVPVARQEAIFEAFEQASTDTAGTYGGTGLGLAITRGFADLLGYRMRVESSPGLGSTFSIVLV